MRDMKFTHLGKRAGKKKKKKKRKVIDKYLRGDNVNGYDPKDRKPDPERLLG